VRYDVPTTALALSPLRHAVLWQQSGSAPIVMSDEPIDGASFEVSFALPEQVSLQALYPTEVLVLGAVERHQGETTWFEELGAEVYRPHVVVYADTNHNGALDLPLGQGFVATPENERGARDRIVAVDPQNGPSVVAFLDPWSALRKLSLDAAQAYYDREGELRRFTVAEGYGVLSPASLRQLRLDPMDSDEAAAHVACGRNVFLRTSERRLGVVLDESLTGSGLWGLEVQNCQSRPLSELDAPPLEASATRVVQCKHSRALEALVVVDRSTQCQGCSCTYAYSTTAWIAERGHTPKWWPCGESLPYCAADDSPLYTLSYECRSEPPEQGNQDAGDAGRADAGPSGDAGRTDAAR
jgi:hypothetical protein